MLADTLHRVMIRNVQILIPFLYIKINPILFCKKNFLEFSCI